MTRWLQWDVWLHWQLMHWHAENSVLMYTNIPPRGGWWGWWGVRRLRLLLHLLLHSLQVQDVLYFALFVCRGKQLEERHREKNRREQDLSRVFTALSGSAFTHLILANEHLNWPAFRKRSLHLSVCCRVCRREEGGGETERDFCLALFLPWSFVNWPLWGSFHYAIRWFSLRHNIHINHL